MQENMQILYLIQDLRSRLLLVEVFLLGPFRNELATSHHGPAFNEGTDALKQRIVLIVVHGIFGFH